MNSRDDVTVKIRCDHDIKDSTAIMRLGLLCAEGNHLLRLSEQSLVRDVSV